MLTTRHLVIVCTRLKLICDYASFQNWNFLLLYEHNYTVSLHNHYIYYVNDSMYLANVLWFEKIGTEVFSKIKTWRLAKTENRQLSLRYLFSSLTLKHPVLSSHIPIDQFLSFR